MYQETTQRFRDVGLASKHYTQEADHTFRQQVANYLRQRADSYPIWHSPNRIELLKRSARLHRQADRYESCGMEYTIIACGACGQVIIGQRRCESRICESCAGKYGAKVRHRQLEIAKSLKITKKMRLMFLTLTKKTTPGFTPQTSDVKQVFNHARKLINKLWPKKQGCGAFAVIEIGKGNNIHIHILVYGFYIPQKTISDRWLKITKDSPIVWIKQVDSARKYVGYLLKYVTKPQNTDDPKDLAYFLDLMIGVRRIRTYGIFYNCGLVPRISSGCPICGGIFVFCGFDDGRRVPQYALFYDEALILVNGGENLNGEGQPNLSKVR